MKRIISFALICVMLVGCVFALASCGAPDSDPKEAKAALEEEKYEVTLKENVAGCKAYIYACCNNVNEKSFEEIEIFYYDSKDAAEKAWNDSMSEKFEKLVAAQDEDYKYEYGIDGALIYYGTKAAIKAAK